MSQDTLFKQKLEAHRKEEWLRLEKILLTVVSGTLVLSVTFFTNRLDVIYRNILGWSWMFLSISLIVLLIGYLFSEGISLYKLKQLEHNIEYKVFAAKETKLNFALGLLNWVSAISAIAGVVLLSIFGYLNLIK